MTKKIQVIRLLENVFLFILPPDRRPFYLQCVPVEPLFIRMKMHFFTVDTLTTPQSQKVFCNQIHFFVNLKIQLLDIRRIESLDSFLNSD